MNTKQAAQVIRDTVTMDQILQIYGYRTKRGFMCCPFHGEKEPSLKVYRNTGGWHCFGCGRGGSVIDFVMEHEQCNFHTAVVAIDKALRMGLTDPHENPFEANRQRRIQTSLDNFVEAVYAYCDFFIKKIEHDQVKSYQKMVALEELRNGQVDKITADDWTFMLSWKDNEDYNNYMIEKLNEFKEEVAAWRRKARRTG